MIAHDGIPVFALLLKSSGFSFKARYVNDVRLPRFGGAAGVRALPLDTNPDMPPYTEQPPASKVPHGDSKDFSPSNANIIPKNLAKNRGAVCAFCRLGQRLRSPSIG